MFVLGVFAEFVVRNQLIDFNDPTASLNAIKNSVFLFKAGIVAFIIALLLDVILSVAFYILTSDANKTFAMLSASFRIIYVAVKGFSLTGLVLANEIYFTLDPFDADVTASTGMLLLKMHHYGFGIGLIFFGMHLIFLGVALSRKGVVPKLITWFLLIGGIGYIITSFINTINLDLGMVNRVIIAIFILPMSFAELALGFWLWKKGREVSTTDLQHFAFSWKDVS